MHLSTNTKHIGGHVGLGVKSRSFSWRHDKLYNKCTYSLSQKIVYIHFIFFQKMEEISAADHIFSLSIPNFHGGPIYDKIEMHLKIWIWIWIWNYEFATLGLSWETCSLKACYLRITEDFLQKSKVKLIFFSAGPKAAN